VNGTTYYESETAGIIKSNETGCDSIIKLVYINPTDEIITDVHTCEPYLWEADDVTYYSDTTVSIFHTGIEGCDSVELLELVFDHVTTIDFVSTCPSHTWIDGITYTSDTTVHYVAGTTDAGCDSIIILSLSIVNPTTVFSVAICEGDSYTWVDGVTYHTDTTVYQYLVSDAGCDSIVTLNLAVTNIDTSVTIYDDLFLKSNEYGIGLTHQWLDCNDFYSEITGEVGFFFYPEINGNYAVEITKDGCKDTSECYAITLLSLEDDESNSVLISPNPSSGQFNLQFQQVKNAQITVSNLNGQIVYQTQIAGQSTFDLQLSEPAGIYILELKTGEENQYYKLVKL
jgi:hypothetical protein